MMPVTINGETCYSTGEACTYLGVSRETLNNYVGRYGLTRYRKGLSNTKYYKLSDLQRIKQDRESWQPEEYEEE